jgi:lysozyme
LYTLHKATDGAQIVDPLYNTNTQLLRNAGLYSGSYHFATGVDPVAQADHYLAVTGLTGVKALDLENNPFSGGNMTAQQADVFVTRIYNRTGRWPLIYTNLGHVNTLGLASSALTGVRHCDLWLALWGNNPILPAGWSTWRFWQFNDGNASNGGPGPYLVGNKVIDHNRFNGTVQDLAAYFQ